MKHSFLLYSLVICTSALCAPEAQPVDQVLAELPSYTYDSTAILEQLCSVQTKLQKLATTQPRTTADLITANTVLSEAIEALRIINTPTRQDPTTAILAKLNSLSGVPLQVAMIEERTQVEATPLTMPTTITMPGSYKLANDIQGGSIIINSDNVCLDLNGHTIFTTPSDGSDPYAGIIVSNNQGTTPHTTITIKNGIIAGTPATNTVTTRSLTRSANPINNTFGIWIQQGTQTVTITDVHLTNNTNTALELEENTQTVIMNNVIIINPCGHGIHAHTQTTGISLTNSTIDGALLNGILYSGTALNLNSTTIQNSTNTALAFSPINGASANHTINNLNIINALFGITYTNAHNTNSSSLSIKDIIDTGIVIDSTSNGLNFSAISCNACQKNGITIAGQRITINNPFIGNCGENGIAIIDGSDTITLRSASISSCDLDGIVNASSNSIIDGATINNCQGVAIRYTGANAIRNGTLNAINVKGCGGALNFSNCQQISIKNGNNDSFERINGDVIVTDRQCAHITFEGISINSAQGVGLLDRGNHTTATNMLIQMTTKGIQAEGTDATDRQTGFRGKGITVHMPEEECILFNHSFNIDIKDIFCHQGTFGIFFSPTTSDVHGENIQTLEAPTGIEFQGTDIHISGWAAHDTTTGGCCDGSLLRRQQTRANVPNAINNYVFHNITIVRAQRGLDFINTGNVIVDGAMISDTNEGVCVDATSSQMTLCNSSIQNSRMNGIRYHGNNLNLSQTTVQNSGGSGICLLGTPTAPIANFNLKNVVVTQAANDPAQATEFGSAGLQIDNAQNVVIAQSDFNTNGTFAQTAAVVAGIEVQNSANIHIFDSKTVANLGTQKVNGICLLNTTMASLLNNTISGNISNEQEIIGIEIDAQSQDADVRNNTVTNNRGNANSAGIMNNGTNIQVLDNFTFANSANNFVGIFVMPVIPEGCCLDNISTPTAPTFIPIPLPDEDDCPDFSLPDECLEDMAFDDFSDDE